MEQDSDEDVAGFQACLPTGARVSVSVIRPVPAEETDLRGDGGVADGEEDAGPETQRQGVDEGVIPFPARPPGGEIEVAGQAEAFVQRQVAPQVRDQAHRIPG